MRKYALFIFIATISSLVGVFVSIKILPQTQTLRNEKPIQRTMDKYSIENLAKAKIPKGQIKLQSDNSFTFNFDPTLENKNEAFVSGQINIPTASPNPAVRFPIILMIRGYVDQKIYKTGVGTQHAAEFFSQNGFITIAPDFLGYGTSSPESNDVLESRFQTYTTILSLLASFDSIDKWDHKNVFIWAHSNGGQIALTTLAITGKNYPAVLWAPVSKFFPYSILYYTDDLDDGGKYLRHEIANFETLYDVNLYSFDKYLNNIKSPIQISQGTADDAVPFKWTDDLVKRLKSQNLDVNYFVYNGSDHNLMPAWNEVIQKDLIFFKNNIKS